MWLTLPLRGFRWLAEWKVWEEIFEKNYSGILKRWHTLSDSRYNQNPTHTPLRSLATAEYQHTDQLKHLIPTAYLNVDTSMEICEKDLTDNSGYVIDFLMCYFMWSIRRKTTQPNSNMCLKGQDKSPNVSEFDCYPCVQTHPLSALILIQGTKWETLHVICGRSQS